MPAHEGVRFFREGSATASVRQPAFRCGFARLTTANSLPEGLIPQVDATGDAIVVRGDLHVSGEFEAEMPRVAAAQVQQIVVQQRIDNSARLEDAPAPFLLSAPTQCLVAGILVVGLPIVEWML